MKYLDLELATLTAQVVQFINGESGCGKSSAIANAKKRWLDLSHDIADLVDSKEDDEEVEMTPFQNIRQNFDQIETMDLGWRRGAYLEV